MSVTKPLAASAEVDVAPVVSGAGSNLRRLLQNNSWAFSGALMLVVFVVTLLTETGGFGYTEQLADVAPLAIAALATAPAIIGGGLDLSISPLMFFVNAAYVVWLAPHGLGGWESVPLLLALGTATGLVSGLVIVGLRVQPVVVTLAMYFALQGVDLVIAPNPVSMSHSTWIYHLSSTVGGIPAGILTIGIPLLIWLSLRFVPFRRLLYAVGSNDATAFSSGVNVNSVRIASYALGGLLAAFGGLALTGLVQASNASEATEYTLTAIAAVVLGGTSLAGGRGGLLGVMFGAFAIYLIQNLLATLGINAAWLQIVYGGVLIVAVVIQGAISPVEGVGEAKSIGWRAPWQRRKLHPPLFDVRTGPALVADATGDGRAAAEAEEILAASAPNRFTIKRVWELLLALQKRLPLIQVLALVAVFLYGAASLPGLGSWISIRTLLLLAALVGLASGGQTLLILMGGFDLGVSGFIVAGALTVTALDQKYHVPFIVAMLGAMVGAAILGGISGYICHRFKINPLVVTLATGTVAVGVVEVQNSGLANGNSPPWLTTLAEPASKTFGIGLPPVVAIWIVVLIIFAVVLHRTKLGRNVYATGANPRAADYALINTRAVWVGAFAFSAASSALVGILIGGYAGTVVSSLGDPYLFQSVVAVIVGGTVFGGPGDYTRTAIGALFLTVLTTVLIGHGVSAALEDVIYGVIILIAVAIYGRERRLRDRM